MAFEELPLDEQLQQLESKMDRLKALYEQYFIGVERNEPAVARKDVVRMFASLSRLQLRNTAIKFRYQTLLSRWNVMQTRFGKTLREIERGTYVRHIARAQRKGIELPAEVAAAAEPVVGKLALQRGEEARREQARGAGGAAGDAGDAWEETTSPDALVDRMRDAIAAAEQPTDHPAAPTGRGAPPAYATGPLVGASLDAGARRSPPPPTGAARPAGGGLPDARSAPPARAPAAPPPPRRSPVPGMSEDELRALHRSYVSARGADVNYDALVSKLEKQVPKILEQYRCHGVRFEVVSQSGKIVLKATPQH